MSRKTVLGAALVLGVAIQGAATPAGAQIIATSLPGSSTAGPSDKLAVRIMASPLAKWKYNELFVGANEAFLDVGQYQGRPNSDFLLAAEAVYGGDFTVGIGGWYNRVGKVDYDFQSLGVFLPTQEISLNEGTLQGDLSVAEVHLNVFYKNFGIQGGLVRTRSTILSSNIETIDGIPTTQPVPLGTVSEGTPTTTTDWDLFGVFKHASDGKVPWGVSLGAGMYRKKGNLETASRLAEDSTVFSAFVTASAQVYKGLGVDASYWYVGRTAATQDSEIPGDDASRFLLGVSYRFSL